MLRVATLILISIIAVAVIFSTSCKKKSNVNYTTLGNDVSTAETYSGAVYAEVDNQAKATNDSAYKTRGWNSVAASATGACASITISPTGWAFPKTITIDYGSGCTDGGITRKGVLTAVFTGFYHDSGTVITISTSNYQQSAYNSATNFYGYNGTKVLTNRGRDTAGHLQFSVVDSNVRITQPNGSVILWSTQRVNTWTAGESTILNWCDDKYSISGEANGVASDGTTFRIDVTTGRPLIKNVCCTQLESGEVTYTVNGSAVATEGFAQALGCNTAADTLHYNGQSYLIYLY